jgi:hypothetical protein
MVADRGRLRVLLSSKEVLRLKLWGVGSGDFPIGPDWSHGDCGVCPPRCGDRYHLADAGGDQRQGAGAQAVCAGRIQSAAIEAASGSRHVHAKLRRRGVRWLLIPPDVAHRFLRQSRIICGEFMVSFTFTHTKSLILWRTRHDSNV